MSVRISTRARPALLLAPLLASLPGPARAAATCSPAPSGRIVFIPGAPSDRRSGLAIADAASGATVATIDTPPIDGLSALRVPGKALATPFDGPALLIDAKSATATPLDLPASLGAAFELRQNLPVGVGARFTVIGDGRDAFLLDTETAAATDLRSLLGPDSPPIPLFNPTLAPDERNALVWDGLRVYLIPTADPAATRPLEGFNSLPGSFSPDGTLLLYGRVTRGKGPRELVVLTLDGSAGPEIISTSRYASGVFVGGNDLIAFNRDKGNDEGTPQAEFVLHDRTTGTERVLLTYDVNPATLAPAPDGSHALFQLQGNDGWAYAMADLASGRMSDVPFTAGLVSVGPLGGRYRLLYPASGVSEGAAAPGYYGIDLDAGTSTILAPTEIGDAIVNVPPTFSLDGSAAIGVVTGADLYRVWHFDLATATASVISESPVAGVALSPDGCWLAVGAGIGDATPTPSGLRVQSPDGATTVDLGPGWQPAWVSQ